MENLELILPKEILDAIEDVTIDRKIIETMVGIELPKPISDILEDCQYLDSNNRYTKFYWAHDILDVFKSINQQIDSKTNEGITANNLLDLEMQTIRYNNTTDYAKEIVKTLQMCNAEKPNSFLKYYKEIKELVDVFPDGDENRDTLSNLIQNLSDEISKHSEQIIRGVSASEFVNFFGINQFLSEVEKLEKNGEDISTFLKEEINIGAEQYKELLKSSYIPNGLTISIKCKNASEISVQDLDDIDGRFNCNSIRFEDINLGLRPKTPYSFDEYKMCRAKIDELLESVIMPLDNEPDREKKIYMQVMQRLAEHIKYNHDIGYKTIAGNMIGGLLERECVCEGYSEIVRNTLACCGIETISVTGEPEKGEDHTWNQVKLDGKWYNMDLTWAREYLIKGIPVQLLLNDKDFASGEHQVKSGVKKLDGHDCYYNRGQEHECLHTIPVPEIRYKYMDAPVHGLLYGEWVNNAHKNVNNTQLRSVEKTMRDDLCRMREKEVASTERRVADVNKQSRD